MGQSPSKPVADRLSTVHEAAKPGQSGIYRNALYKELVATFDARVTTLYENFQRTAGHYPSNNFLGVRQGGGNGPYGWINYQQAQTRASNLGSGFVKLGLEPGKDLVGLWSLNRPEWVIGAQAANCFTLPTVPLYETLGPSASEFIIRQAGLKLVVTSKNHTSTLFEMAKKCPSLKYVVQMEPVDKEQTDAATQAGVQVLAISEVEDLGAKSPVAHRPPQPDDLAVVCYTSGTTGDPKGAMLTHGNIIADLSGVLVSLSGSFAFTPADVHISYLPLAHMFERTVEEAMIAYGSAIGFFGGNVLKLFEDIVELKPTLFPSVPRVFNRLHEKITQGIQAAGGMKKRLFDTAVAAKMQNLQRGVYTHSIWDPIVFHNITARLGGRVRLMVTGSAPISKDVLTFLRVCFCCPVLEGYGQTETGAAMTITGIEDTEPGHVGPPLVCNEIKLVDVPDMNYFATDSPFPRGEICVRGPNVFKGYYLDKERTAEALDSEGWLHSGDVGLITGRGQIKIIDRKKNIFKLAQGEYIAPDKIEIAYGACPLIAQSFVYGDSLQACLVGIIVPNFETLEPWAKEQKLDPKDRKALCDNSALRKLILDGLVKAGKAAGLHSFEQVKAVRLVHEMFSVENDLLTPTFKLKRPQARKAFQDLIDDAYREASAASSASTKD